MAFEKGNEEHKKRKRRAGGRPTKEEARAKEIMAEELERELRAQAKRIAKQYVHRALSKGGDRLLMHIVDKVLPNAREAGPLEGSLAGMIDELFCKLAEGQ